MGRMGGGGHRGLLCPFSCLGVSSPSLITVAHYSLPKKAFTQVPVLLKETHGKDLHFYHSTCHCSGGPRQCRKTRKRNKARHAGKGEMKLSLFTDDMNFEVESTKRLLELISQSRKIPRSETNIQKSTVFSNNSKQM